MRQKWRVCPQNRNYKISNTGLCKSVHTKWAGHYLTPVHTGYADMYVLCSNYDKKKYRVQHLVYTAFVGEVPKGYMVYNKDGNLYNNNLENLDIMPRGDKIFWFSPLRTKKLPRMTAKNKCTFVINGQTYQSCGEIIKVYPQLGTKQNVHKQADRWLKGESARGTEWRSEGFTIRGILIWATRNKIKNQTKKRMDRIQKEHKLTRRHGLIKIKGEETCEK